MKRIIVMLRQPLNRMLVSLLVWRWGTALLLVGTLALAGSASAYLRSAAAPAAPHATGCTQVPDIVVGLDGCIRRWSISAPYGTDACATGAFLLSAPDACIVPAPSGNEALPPQIWTGRPWQGRPLQVQGMYQ